MKSLLKTACVALLVFAALTSSAVQPSSDLKKEVVHTVSSMPVFFRENKGQWEKEIYFQGIGTDKSIRFLKDKISFAFTRFNENSVAQEDSAKGIIASPEALICNLNFLKSNPEVSIHASNKQNSYANYIGVSGSYEHVEDYGSLKYKNLYNNIDLLYYPSGNNLKYDYVVKPGGDITDIQMNYEGVENVSITHEGQLEIISAWGKMLEEKPYSYQLINGEKKEIRIEYRLINKTTFGFKAIGAYNPALPLVIDPSIQWASYVGGSGATYGYINDIATDASGDIYATGTYWSNFPITVGATYSGTSANNAAGDVYVFKLSNNGSTLVYATYLGGLNDDYANSICVRGTEAYVTGRTASSNFPTTAGSYQPTMYSGGWHWDAFVCRLNSAGSILLSTFIGPGAAANNGYEEGNEIIVNSSGEIFVAGYAQSANFPITAGVVDATYSMYEGFICKLNAAGSSLIFSTFLGGSDYDGICGMAINGSGEIYVTGYTTSNNFTTTAGAYDQTFNGGNVDIFVTKLNSTCTSILASTYIGGAANEDYAYELALNSTGEVIVCGYTRSNDFPTIAGYDLTNNGGYDAILFKMNSSLSTLMFSTYFGGCGSDEAHCLTITANDQIVVSGTAGGCSFPTTCDRYSATGDGFIAKFNSSGSTLIYSTSIDDRAFQWTCKGGPRTTLDPFSTNNFFVGISALSMTGTAGAFQQTKLNAGGAQPMILKLDITANISTAPAAPGSISGSINVCRNQNGVVYNITPISGATSYNWTVPGGATIASGATTSTITVNYGGAAVTGSVCARASNACGNSSYSCLTVTVSTTPSAPATPVGSATVCANQTAVTYSVAAVSGATSYNWTAPATATITAGQGTNSITVNFGASGGNICVSASNTCGTSSSTCRTITIRNVPAAPVIPVGTATLCANQTAVTYSVAAVSGATSYNWTAPATATITAGQGTNSITVNFGTTGGSICVSAVNACGSGAQTCKTITVNNIALSSSANISICKGTTTLLTVGGATTYAWSPSTGLSATTGSSITAGPTSTTTYSVTGTTNGCTAQRTTTVTIKNKSNSSITTSACNSYVLNAQTFTVSGIYTQTLTNAAGCDSVITLNLTINNAINTSGTVSVCSGQSIIIHGINRSTAGIYSQTFTAANGCDSISVITLNVKNNSSNIITASACNSYVLNAQTYTTSGIYSQTLTNAAGCDSVITLNLTINNTINTSGTISICSGQSVMIHGINRSTSGIYSQTYTAVGGCDSISAITLSVKNNSTNSITTSSCNSYVLNGQTYTTSGIYSQTITNVAGCDSIITLNLTINNTINTSGTISVCPGQSALIHGINRTLAGIYSQTFIAANGCDSISDITLNVKNNSNSSLTTSACNSYVLNGQTYTTSGIYSQTLTNAGGCDSIITLNLTISNTINTSGSISICPGQSIAIHGISRNISGLYTQTFVAAGGCDSISAINLTVNSMITNTITPHGCSNYTHNGQTYTTSGIYTQTLVAANGCDSILTIDLTIGNPIYISSTRNICSGQSVLIHGTSQNTSGVYSQTFTAVGGCDSISTITLNVHNNSSFTINQTTCSAYVLNGQTYNTTGIYSQTLTNAAGCDSIITLNLTINNTIYTSGSITICSGQSVLIHGINQNSPGIYSQTFVAASGCDSVSAITLTINNPVNTSGSLSICAGQSVLIHGVNQNTSGVYSQTYTASNGCDSISVITLTVNSSINTNGAISICLGQSTLIHGSNQNIAGIYTQTFSAANGCDSISTITLTVNNNINTSGAVNICAGQSAIIHGVVQNMSGIYSQTFVAAGGCDSISTITLVVNSISASTIIATACNSYVFNGTTYNLTGIYTQTLTNTVGCDSIITLNLTISNTINTSSSISICSGQAILIHGTNQNMPGIYSQTYTAANGCDSISAITLIVNNNINTSNSITICNGQSVLIHGINQNTSGVYSQTFVAAGGCDSISTVTLTVNNSSNYILNQVACNNFTLNGQTYTSSGIYSQTLTNASGCDSIITLNLTLNNIINTSGSVSICAGQSVLIHGLNQNTAGVYSQTFTSVSGCDSISDITLIINTSSSTTLNQTACNNYILNGQTYTSTGVYTQTIANSAGCDSIITLNLTINGVINTNNSISVCAGQSAVIHGANQNIAGIYSQTFVAAGGCDSISSVTLTVNNSSNYSIVASACNSYLLNGQTYTSTGIYTQTLSNSFGCDSIITLTLTIGNIINTNGTVSVCSGQSVLIHGINQSIAGVYSQTYTAAGGCDSISDITLTIHTLPIVSFTNDVNQGCGELCVNFNNTTPNTQHTQWSFGNGSASNNTNPYNCYSVPGLYSITLTVTDMNNCINTLVQNDYIAVYPNPIANFIATPNTASTTNSTIAFINQSTNSNSWVWNYGDVSNSNSTSENSYFSYSGEGTYVVSLIAANEFGCADTAYNEITITPEFAFYAPNSITPNNDNINDIFLPKGMNIDPGNFELLIFDRWGNKIFKTNNSTEGWNARVHGTGEIVQQDTYIWRVTLTDTESKGHVYDGIINVIH